MIRRLLNIYILPVKYIPLFLKFIILKMLGANLRNTYTEWVNSFHLALLYSNSRDLYEDKEIITCLSKENNYKIAMRKYPSSDVLVYNHIFGNPREYEFVCKTYDKYFKSDNLFIIDAGANVAYASLYFAYKYKNCKIVSIEPEPSNFNMIIRNIENNYLYNVITPINKALWYSNTTLELFTDNKKEWSFSVNEIQDTSTDNKKTETITINEILLEQRGHRINILKVDIEGAEFELFLDIERHKDFIKDTELVAMEIHDRKEKYEKIIENFTKQGFTFLNSGELTIFINNNLINVNN